VGTKEDASATRGVPPEEKGTGMGWEQGGSWGGQKEKKFLKTTEQGRRLCPRECTRMSWGHFILLRLLTLTVCEECQPGSEI
jgi:hypothetical protein